MLKKPFPLFHGAPCPFIMDIINYSWRWSFLEIPIKGASIPVSSPETGRVLEKLGFLNH